jgi:hypothetical protein
MNFDRIFSPEGLNWWVIVSGIGMNFLLMTLLMISVIFAGEGGISLAVTTIAMSLGGFLIPLLTAYVCGRLGDERFLSYAFYPLIGYLVPVIWGVISAGVLGILMIAFGVLGAFNGGALAARRAFRRRHYVGDKD